MADALNAYIAAMAPLQQTNLLPHERLSNSANLPDEYLLNHPITSHRQAITAARWQQHNPQLFYQQLRLRTPHMARRPVLPKKSLNSWMAFRSFYQLLFPHLQQKEASRYLTVLWKRDSFKAKWTVIAAAYSKIRDAVGKPRAPLDRYLSIVCPQMGIIAVHSYLRILNWTLETTTEGNLLLVQTSSPDLQTLDPHILTSNMTEKDVVDFCGSAGYIPQLVARRIGGANLSQAPQHGLLASTPLGVSSSPNASGGEASTEVAVDTPQPDLQTIQSYPWTGSMSDLYHPTEGSMDFDQLLNDPYASAWNTVNIHDPLSLDTLVTNGGLKDGFLASYSRWNSS
ncbi:uncharacterized protein L3040_006085 [Drepanopeziza brunnea f. sp. 'multigermtubi']|uniref:uncharacterized protein n=1 Tax=Drepanopeziza brunnea f. sp. 'multigermtubi' TaxID=698441 RepID=UPI00220E2BAA|nr:hypothetical protein L3040_006085 [Drepanopeziza brunnea f. sp. 'multigermtubi']UTN00774.1 MAT1-1-1 [Drepanopeziza brunnea f. sp. 'multigermtubi']UTN00777.1 MAT1-1-1 [Drepanopeziza brunnea f. sp. 'multigermtubi']